MRRLVSKRYLAQRGARVPKADVFGTSRDPQVRAADEIPSFGRFDARSMGRAHLDGGLHEDEAGMLASVATIKHLVAEEVDAGIPSERIIVGGFSQGSAISLLTGLTSERKLAGLVCLSGWLGLSAKAGELATEEAKALRIFWGHGAASQFS
jgi:predicted esterase